ncbi:MAG: ATP-binding cassette domain-containing protein [Anaeromyxobacteraceae bacterium]
MIVLEGVKKSFGEVEALRGVSFEVGNGQITGLLGPNGAGKTTALRTVYGVIVPDAGRVHVDGVDLVTDRIDAQRRLGILPHAQGLYARLTAREHVLYFARLHGMARATAEARADSLIELLGMREFADRRTEGFSQGQRVKVAMARALVHDPHNVVLDEPTNGLDVAATRAVRALLLKLRDEGRCVLFSSHVMQEVSALCDRVIVIARGQVVAEGTPDELRRATGKESLEDALVAAIGSEEGLE